MSRTTQRIAAITITVAGSLAPYLEVSTSYFSQDDFGLLWLLSAKPWFHFLTLFHTPWTEDIWGFALDELRPFPALAFQVDYWIGGTNPTVYHVTNMLIHTASGLAVLAIARSLKLTLVASTLAAILFVVWPGHVESVAWITGRCELLMGFGYVTSVLTFHWWSDTKRTRWLWTSLGAAGISLFSKQSGVTLVVALWAGEILLRRQGVRETFRRTTGHLALTCGFLVLRHIAFSDLLRFDRVSDSAITDYALIQVEFMQRLVLLEPSWNPSPSIAVALVGAGLAALIVVVTQRLRGGSPPGVADQLLYWGPAWWIITTLPLLVAGYSTNRFLYVSTAGCALAAGVGLSSLIRRSRPVTLIIAVIVLATSITGIHQELGWWKRAGIQARALTASSVERARSSPPGTLLLVDAPGEYWIWALPYAFEPPFVPIDVSRRVRMIWPQAVDCCRGSHWLGRMQRAVSEWRENATASVEVLHWQEDRLIFRRTTLDDRQFENLAAQAQEIQTVEAFENWLQEILR